MAIARLPKLSTVPTALAEVMLPDAIDHHAARSGIIRAEQSLGQFERPLPLV